MKSLLTFLAFNVVLLICWYEKKCAGSMLKPAHIEYVNYEDTFEVKSDADKANDRKWHSHMNIFITTDFLKGYDPSDGFRGHVNVVGAVNDKNEMILIESQNGKVTRTFLGEFQKKGKGTMILLVLGEAQIMR